MPKGKTSRPNPKKAKTGDKVMSLIFGGTAASHAARRREGGAMAEESVLHHIAGRHISEGETEEERARRRTKLYNNSKHNREGR